MARKTKLDKIRDKYQEHKKDTGSTPIQIVELTMKIKELSDHLKNHKKDIDSKVGFLKMISKRKKLLIYLYRQDQKVYNKLTGDLDL
jgi:small subunit ribosomal protein S15